ncbi:MAG: S-layer homology domain-containing protein [Clostridia bacterium]|nr:S-layer homology domain-containing protein [Clostridia bacterium]
MNKKQIISFLMTVVMMCTSFGVVLAEDAVTADTETKIEFLDTDESRALYAMGFLGEEIKTTAKDAYITRAQFTGYLFRLSGYALSEHKGIDIPFVDVNPDTPYYNEICTMYEIGIVNGTEANIFSPDAHVTYSQACKLIIDVLGYRTYAEIKYGEYPEGYVMMAGELEINEDVRNVKWDAELTAEDAVTMLYNAALTEMVVFSGIDEFGNPTYKKSEMTLLEKSDIYYDDGIMQSNGLCSLLSSDTADGKIVIDGISYASSDIDLSDLLGCRVKYFYRDDKKEKKLLWATADTRFTKVIDFKAYDLMITSPDYTQTNIVYYTDDNKTKSVKVERMADVIYNNSYYEIVPSDLMKIKTGTMRLIDNNSDDVYDVVIIEEFYNVFVKSVTQTSQHIIDKYNNTIKLDKYDIVKIIKDGKEIGLTDIGSNVLLSCVENKEKTVIYIYVMNQRYEGTLKSIGTSRNRKIYNFEDASYRLASDYEDKMADTNLITVNLTPGRKYTYYLDMAGEIAEVKGTDTSLQYAYLMSARAGEVYEDGIVYTRLLLSDGSKVTGITGKKTIIDGEKKPSSEILTNPAITDENGSFKPQIVMVSFAEDGSLKEIDFAVDNTDGSYGYNKDEFSLDSSNPGKSVRNANGYIIVDYKYMFTSDAVVFVKWTDIDVPEPYTVMTRSALSGGQYSVLVYDADETFTSSVAYKEQSATMCWLTGRMLVDNVDIVYEDGQEVKRVSGYIASEYRSVTEFAPGVFPEDIKRGDLIKISHYNNKATKIVRDMTAEDFNEKTIKWISGNTPDQKDSIIYSPVYSVTSMGISFLNPPEWEKYGKVCTSGFKGGYKLLVLIYNTSTDEIYQGDITDLYQVYSPNPDGSLPDADDLVWAYSRTNYSALQEIVLVVN